MEDDSDSTCLLDIAVEIFSSCFSLKENQVTHLHCSCCRTAIIPPGSPKNNRVHFPQRLYHYLSSSAHCWQRCYQGNEGYCKHQHTELSQINLLLAAQACCKYVHVVTFLQNAIALLLARFMTLLKWVTLKACSFLSKTERESGNVLIPWMLFVSHFGNEMSGEWGWKVNAL